MTSAHSATVHVFDGAGETAEALARDLAQAIRASGADRFRMALSGGSTPKLLFERLARPDISETIPWENVDLFWSDERCVPPSDPASNTALVQRSLIDRVPLPAVNVHPIDGSKAPVVAASDYEATLGQVPFDAVLLGMGGDGHTASLFPGGAELESSGRVVSSKSPIAPRERVSLTLQAINAAGRVMFFVLGDDKAARIAEVMEELAGERSRATLPAAMVRPERGAHWYLDRAAAQSLQRSEVRPC